MSATAHVVMEALNSDIEHPMEKDVLVKMVKDTVGNFLHQQTGRRPMIIPVVVEV